MPGLDDWILTPYRILDRIFDECGPNGAWKERTSEFFTQEINNPLVLKRIPWLNETPLHHLRPNQVVRYRGMVQDMYDNEFFLDTYEVRDKTGSTKLRPGRYKDIAECGPDEELVRDSHECQTGDRLTYYCIPTPGENAWVKEVYSEMNPCMSEASTSSSCGRTKRSVCEETEDDQGDASTGRDANQQTAEGTSMETAESGENKRFRTDIGNASADGAGTSRHTPASTSNGTPDLNFPIPGMKGTPCLVKLYDDVSFSLNDVIEIVGILSVDPSLARQNANSDNNEMEFMDVEEDAARCPPPSLVPRLHVLTARKMPHTNPLLPGDVVESDTTNGIVADMRETREVLRKILEEAFLGDALTAELMVCHLVSSVYLRQDVIALGKYSINVSGISKSLQEQKYTSSLYQLLSLFVTQSHFFPMTLSNMNKVKFVPKKDYQSNRLISGLLQLSQHTHLVLDETALTAGQLDTQGVQNLTALGNAINWQKVDYDFQYHQLEQFTNIPVIIFSEGRAMISSDAEIRLQPNNTEVSAAFNRIQAQLTPDILRRIRIYLTVARLSNYNLSEDMQKMVQDDFVDSRKNDNGISAEDLHNLLILARLVAVSCGENHLTADVWKCTKILENERKLRVRSQAQ